MTTTPTARRTVAPAQEVRYRSPTLADASRMHALIERTPPLEANSLYAYLLLAYHFADTCVVAEHGDRLVGFVTAYRPPVSPRALFVWQVAVDPSMRGRGLASGMLQELLRGDAGDGVRFLEATVTPSNDGSRALFRSLARRLDTRCDEQGLFSPTLFGAAQHEEEVLFRIGPLGPRHTGNDDPMETQPDTSPMES